MGPFTLLITPVAAVFLFIVKMFVAAGYAITDQARHVSALPTDGGRPGVAVYSMGPVGDTETLIVRLASGETFATPRRAAPATRMLVVEESEAGRLPAAVRLIELTSSSGRTMRCALRGAPGSPDSGHCVASDGSGIDLLL
jgi:hypothetical protein